MFTFSIVLWGIALATSVVAQNYPGCKGGLYADIGKAISSYPPAQTYCSFKFPVPAQTTTIAAPTSTLTSTVLTTTTTTGTTTVTSTVATTTTSYTATMLSTTTITTTITFFLAKRGADPTAEWWKSVLLQASAFVGAICTCIKKPKTSTVTITPLTSTTTTST
ncbi:hypothetical protein E8E12_002739 [Didymella heteroderae]|uniref:Uncharacterized protein n=1 Tax=Didymella heteroderae TaxID=1769908 RepID=A0A9P4WJ93_9PLEO|nr:hypothetical protein E8E12_002739 [Didymella heteroderae]